MKRSTRRYFGCILISVTAFTASLFPILVVMFLRGWAPLDAPTKKFDISTSIGSVAAVLPIVALATIGGFVAREKGRWIGGWSVCSLLWPLLVLLVLLPYEEYRRGQLNGTLADLSSDSGIEIRPTFPAIAFLLFLVEPRLVINGNSESILQWGERRFFPLQPGDHTITIYFNYMFGRHGKKTAIVTVAKNETRRILYFARPLMFVPAIIRVY